MKRRMISLCMAFLLSMAILPTAALAVLSPSPMKVRVGFHALDGYHMVDEKGYRRLIKYLLDNSRRAR